ncbi:hypothetical protein D770_15000 [Flammeovirgaceae bacterium 311]|nr:hypothetical protein D770_15000 [Flammeovirgaceae bacterium 311]
MIRCIRLGHGDIDPMLINYEFVNSLTGGSGKKIFIGDSNNKTCRFCNRDSTQTTFRKKAHLIPELTGNKLFFSNFECDSCNSIFSKYEDSFANFGGIINTLSMIKGKRGIPKYKGNKGSFEAFVQDGAVQLMLTHPEGSSSLSRDEFLMSHDAVKVDRKNNKLHFNTEKTSYIPQDVLKVFVKIGYSMLSNEEVLKYDLTRKWLINEFDTEPDSPHPLLFLVRRVGGSKYFKHPLAFLAKRRYKRENYPCPEHTLILFYGVFAYQIFLPFNYDEKWLLGFEEIQMPIMNDLAKVAVDANNITVSVDTVDLSSKERKKGKDNFSVDLKEDDL